MLLHSSTGERNKANTFHAEILVKTASLGLNISTVTSNG